MVYTQYMKVHVTDIAK